jgi:hypothetical protein
MDRQNNMLWFNLGSLYEQLGRPDEARRCFRNIAPAKEVVSTILIPLGFMIFLISGATMMFQHGDKGLPIVVIASAIFCLFWLKRDGGRALQMMMKKKKAQQKSRISRSRSDPQASRAGKFTHCYVLTLIILLFHALLTPL